MGSLPGYGDADTVLVPVVAEAMLGVEPGRERGISPAAPALAAAEVILAREAGRDPVTQDDSMTKNFSLSAYKELQHTSIQ